ncbi:hypothetical protein PR048_001846 [Dryococelus australis]|uniref:Uncharacterized protein n=1 Tax=Dryococelus australis TaxID=614101 RepID=A0ABQ9IIL4_9NEOP|nr:hypothetical protein PR048_001846 [Dryococelus australis]
MRVIEVSMEQHRNERVGETGDPRENSPTNGIVQHGDSNLQKGWEDPYSILNSINNEIFRICRQDSRAKTKVVLIDRMTQRWFGCCRVCQGWARAQMTRCAGHTSSSAARVKTQAAGGVPSLSRVPEMRQIDVSGDPDLGQRRPTTSIIPPSCSRTAAISIRVRVEQRRKARGGAKREIPEKTRLPVASTQTTRNSAPPHLGEPGSSPNGGRSRESTYVGIVPDDAAGRRVFSGISRLDPPLHSGAVQYSLRFILVSSQDLDEGSYQEVYRHLPTVERENRHAEMPSSRRAFRRESQHFWTVVSSRSGPSEDIKIFLCLMQTKFKRVYRVGLRSGNSLDSHSGGPGFDSRPGYPDFGFPWFHEDIRGECWDGTVASHHGEPGSIPDRVTGFEQVGIVPDDAVGWCEMNKCYSLNESVDEHC